MKGYLCNILLYLKYINTALLLMNKLYGISQDCSTF